MKLTKAIEILESFQPEANYPPDPQAWEAFKLGIQALKYYLKVRKGPYHNQISLLPGETKD